MATEVISMFHERTFKLLREFRVIGYKYINENSEDKDQQADKFKDKDQHQDKTGVSCLVCKVAAFDSVKAQRDHFKLDWHRFNVKQRLMNKPTVSEAEFEETISGELSSISGSDSSESESDNDDDDDFAMEGASQVVHENLLEDDNDNKNGKAKPERRHPKIFLCNSESCVFSVYRATVYSSKNIPDEETQLINKLTNLTKESWWMILMTGGGHFAAAVFDGDSVVAHKTFHRYTVRAKRGSAQGVRDSQQGIQPRSAGASLRRYNEAALVQEVHDLLGAWSEYLGKCHKIFIRVQTYNKPMFFGGKKPPLDKNDPRIRTIPFATRRPTFKEVQRVHEMLAKVEIIGQESEVLSEVLNQLSLNQNKSQTKSPVAVSSTPLDNGPSQKNADEAEQEQGNDRLHVVVDNITEHLEDAVGITSASADKKSKRKKANARIADGNGKEKISGITGGPERDVVLPAHHVWNRLYCAVVSGNVNVITELLLNDEVEQGIDGRTLEGSTESKQSQMKQVDEGTNDTENVTDAIKDFKLFSETEYSGTSGLLGSKRDAREVLSERWGEEGSTLLHTAARSTQVQIIDVLMRHGADPSVKDDRGRTPYDRANSKEARDGFRRFMADYPDAFDYTKSHIPSPLTQELKEEKERKEAEKKKTQRKARKQRIKEQKATEQKKREEEEERKKNEKMSDREKRAQAAERRFAKQQLRKNNESSGSCAMCSQDLTGHVPFERLDFKYCSTACVRQHRLILENKGR